jgi:8-hydroxy-5-deazaflavin:NADPH oxidoreductase
MKIAIIGAGRVGAALGSSWAKHGHEIVFGVRDPSKHDAWTNARVAGVMEAARSAEVVVLAVPWGAVEDALRSMGDLKGRILIDATNPLLPDLSGLDTGAGNSGGEKVASLAPGALVVKMFNTTGSGNMTDPIYHAERITMLYCGDDDGAKKIAARLAGELGFDPVDVGPLNKSGALENMALLWVTLAFKQGLGPNFAFRLVRR